MRALVLIACLLLAAAWTAQDAGAAAGPCHFVLGFEVLHAAIPEIVGGCTGPEQHNPRNGDALQPTQRGLLVWRKADNWTAFTDGARTWINGPCGLEQRPNNRRFTWEGGDDCTPLDPPWLGYRQLSDFPCPLSGGVSRAFDAQRGPVGETAVFEPGDQQAVLHLLIEDCPLQRDLAVEWRTFGPGGFDWDTLNGVIPAGDLASNGWQRTLTIAGAADAWPGAWHADVLLDGTPVATYWFVIEGPPASPATPTATPPASTTLPATATYTGPAGSGTPAAQPTAAQPPSASAATPQPGAPAAVMTPAPTATSPAAHATPAA